MIIMYVTYAGTAETEFDRDHWINVHLPLVRETWGPHGLLRTDGFFPSGDESGLIAICPCIFRDEAAMKAALADPGTKAVMNDVKNVTDVKPQQSLATPL